MKRSVAYTPQAFLRVFILVFLGQQISGSYFLFKFQERRSHIAPPKSRFRPRSNAVLFREPDHSRN